MNEFFTWEMLVSFAGCCAATTIITQFIKNVPALAKINNQLISYVIAFIIMVAGSLAIGTFTVDSIGLDLVNAVVVSFAANGLFDGVNAAKKALMPVKTDEATEKTE